jgi:helicase MOV-10
MGRYSANLEIQFEDTTRRRRFIIVRTVTAVVVGDQADHEALAPTAPFERPARRAYRRLPFGSVVPGERSGAFIRHPYKIKLGAYPIPQELVGALESGSGDVGAILGRLPPAFRPAALNHSNYVKRIGTQLWVEEHQAV